MYCLFSFSDALTNQSIVKSNENLYYEFPKSTSQCDFSTTSLFLSVSSECNLKLTPEEATLQDFYCYEEFQQFDVEVDYDNNTVCLSNWNLTSNHITVHFLCLSDCPVEGCNRIYNFVSSHEILIGICLILDVLKMYSILTSEM